MPNAYKQIPADDDVPAPRPDTQEEVVANDASARGTMENENDDDDANRPLRRQLRSEFNRPPPATWKRVLLVAAIIFMGWLAIRLGRIGKDPRPQIIYATR